MGKDWCAMKHPEFVWFVFFEAALGIAYVAALVWIHRKGPR